MLLPNNMPSAWVNRSKVSKKKGNSSNIFASQKQITFEDNTDEYHRFIPPIHTAGSTATESNEVTSSIIAIDEIQTRTLSASVSTNQGTYANTTTQQQQQTHQEHQQQQQQQHFQQIQQQQQQQHLSDQKNASPSSFAKKSTSAVIPSASHSHRREINLVDLEKDPDVTIDELNTAIEHHKHSASDFLTPSSQQLESLVMG